MEPARQLKQVAPSVKMIVLLPMCSGEYQETAARYRVDACIEKARIGEILLPMIQQIFSHDGLGERGRWDRKRVMQSSGG